MIQAGHFDGHRQQLLEKLQLFEQTAEQVRPELKGFDISEAVSRFREAATVLQAYLKKHPASKETANWPELPDTDADVAAFASGLKAEHRELLSEIAELIRASDEIEKTVDRVELAAQLRKRSLALVLRIARHAGEEEAPLGDYT